MHENTPGKLSCSVLLKPEFKMHEHIPYIFCTSESGSEYSGWRGLLEFALLD